MYVRMCMDVCRERETEVYVYIYIYLFMLCVYHIYIYICTHVLCIYIYYRTRSLVVNGPDAEELSTASGHKPQSFFRG